ncbi:TfoX/Sxy family protein [Luteibaculum oceani]|uniref:TfoX/Sxy family protein n=1 Tax=Luteibaculum oceani TaxID=1294296 RepID=A0A5C6VB41_9FLAO|nr:TfoX/Sxy family protein [Luteibaculum oceani]TXC81606.1 TfoX/Sxy family protein [Luteibaculum oceani]
MAFNQALADRITDYLMSKRVKFYSKKMFGGLCFMVDDKMCVGIIADQLMARIGPEAYPEALTKPHTSEMDFTGKAMKGYVYVDQEGWDNDADLEHWLGLALAFNPKAKSSKRR